MFGFITYLLSKNDSQSIDCVRFKVTEAVVVIQVFWYMTPCQLVKLPTFRVIFMPLDREYVQSAPNLRTIYPEDAGSKLRRNTGIYQSIRHHMPGQSVRDL
jgi:hypothetical protein